MMLYVFTQASSINSFYEYLIRILTIFLGIFIVISFSLITSLIFKKNIIKDLINDRVQIYHGLSHEIPFAIQHTKVKSVVTIHDLIFLRFPQ